MQKFKRQRVALILAVATVLLALLVFALNLVGPKTMVTLKPETQLAELVQVLAEQQRSASRMMDTDDTEASQLVSLAINNARHSKRLK